MRARLPSSISSLTYSKREGESMNFVLEMAVEERNGVNPGPQYMIFRPETVRVFEAFRLIASADDTAVLAGLIESSEEIGTVVRDHRWVIVVSIIMCRIILLLRKPMRWIGMLVEFVLNLPYANGGLLGLLLNLTRGRVIFPKWNSDTFISTIGHLDERIDLFKGSFNEGSRDSSDVGFQMETRVLMDLCMMASKLAYENEKVVRNVVVHKWKMHFVDFYNCWNDFEKERSTQVFILSDKPNDASLILVSFRGTEPFDAGDWATDFDYSWYEIPEFGKLHIGFLEALGLGNRTDVSSFHELLQFSVKLHSERLKRAPHVSNGPRQSASFATSSSSHSSWKGNEQVPPETTAYYAVCSKLKIMLEENKNAKFVVTGHSLGGALAILFPTVLVLHKEEEMMQRLLGVYTFGQPRIGDRQLARNMEFRFNYPVQRYFRVVYCNDLIPRLPYDNKEFSYKHFGVCLYYNSFFMEEKVEEEPNPNYFRRGSLIPRHLNAIWELIRSFFTGCYYGKEYQESCFCILLRFVGLALPGISAHCPSNYVNSIRLGRERAQMSSF